MVIINVYGKIPKTLISDKLKIYISNIPDDWKEEIIEDVLKEVRQQKFNILEDEKRYGKTLKSDYSLSYFQKIVKENIKGYTKNNIDSIENCIQCLVDNMIHLYFDYEYSDMPFFDWSSNCFDGRFCEEDYAEKVINFINFIHHDFPNEIHIDTVYSSNNDHLHQSIILFKLGFKINTGFNHLKTQSESIAKLVSTGKKIDNYINSESDYYKFDYILNSIYKDNDYNQNHFFKTYSLLELTLLEPYQRTSEVDNLLVPYLNKKYGNELTNVAKILRQMRNKIGHGDFKGFNNKAEEFAQKYMKHYSFDYSEYSRLNWILLYTCCLLDDLLRNILFKQLTN